MHPGIDNSAPGPFCPYIVKNSYHFVVNSMVHTIIALHHIFMYMVLLLIIVFPLTENFYIKGFLVSIFHSS